MGEPSGRNGKDHRVDVDVAVYLVYCHDEETELDRVCLLCGDADFLDESGLCWFCQRAEGSA